MILGEVDKMCYYNGESRPIIDDAFARSHFGDSIYRQLGKENNLLAVWWHGVFSWMKTSIFTQIEALKLKGVI